VGPRNQEAVDDHPVFAPRHGRAPGQTAESQIELVRRLVRAHDDPGKQRIRAWLRELDDEQLASLGLTPEDILLLRH
jgi:hypothetical protein